MTDNKRIVSRMLAPFGMNLGMGRPLSFSTVSLLMEPSLHTSWSMYAQIMLGFKELNIIGFRSYMDG